MRITDALLGEHGVFYAQFDHIEGTLDDGADVAALRREAALLGSALAPHAHIENELLFERMARAAPGPASVMLHEHAEIEELVERAAVAATVEDARALLRSAIGLARDHFRKEEMVAFPLARSALGETELHALGGEWARRRGVEVRE